MKNKFIAISTVIIFLMILLLFIVSLSKIKVEGSCEIDKLSFDVNETRKMENISLSDGKINCNFKAESPLWMGLYLK